MGNQDGIDKSTKTTDDIPESGFTSRVTNIMYNQREGEDLSPVIEGEANKLNALFQEGHKAGYGVGHTQGYQAGYGAGYREGQSKGYTSGYNKALERTMKTLKGGKTDEYKSGEEVKDED